MSGDPTSADILRAALGPHGLFLRGIAQFTSGAGPLLVSGATAASVVLIGPVGGSLWPAFGRWREQDAGGPEPLDRWSKAVIIPLAERFSATAYFPSDPPWQPFQQWAMRAEGLKASPLGILIHPDYGLWYGYRGALGFDEAVEDSGMATRGDVHHPCDTCVEKPCLVTCPVDAIEVGGFRYTPCRSHLASPNGRPCLNGGCIARNACPVGMSYRYPEEQLRFHMSAPKR